MTEPTSVPLRPRTFEPATPAPELQPATAPAEADVQRIAFAQCVTSMRRTLLTTPLGWGLATWLCWERQSLDALPGWLALVASGWALCIVMLEIVRRQGADVTRHAGRVRLAAIVDGLCWGSMAPWLMGPDVILNAAIAAVLCGVAAVNAPVYIARIQLFYCQGAAMWLMVLLNSLRTPQPPMANIAALGMALMLGLLFFYLHGIGARVVEGIRLQLANAALAAQLQQALAAMARQASTDALTGLPNRRSLDDAMAVQLTLAAQEARPFAVLMLDLDHFKAINDTHGHATGDAVLRAFAERLEGELRRSDSCARYGGEEFVVVLGDTPLELALEVAERLRRAVGETPLVPGLTATVSVGATCHRPGDGMADLLARADAALYDAKRAGRDRVVMV